MCMYGIPTINGGACTRALMHTLYFCCNICEGIVHLGLFFRVLFCFSLMAMVGEGRAGRINTETALSMLDTSFSENEFNMPDDDPNSESDLRQQMVSSRVMFST